MKKNILATFAAALTILALSGCANMSVPKRALSADFKNGTIHLSTPSDVVLEGLQILHSTNGQTIVIVQRYTSKTNPDVITQTMSGQAELWGRASESSGTAIGNAFRAMNGLPPASRAPAPIQPQMFLQPVGEKVETVNGEAPKKEPDKK